MKALITGGFGFIGSHICNEFSNYEVYVIDNLLKQVHNNDYNIIKDVDFTCGDVSETKTWQQFYGKSFDVLIHLAAETGTGQSAYAAAQCCKTNILSTAIINDIIVNKKIEFGRVILASSRAVYGRGYANTGIKESDIPMPISIYGISKLAQEQILLNSSYSDMVTVLRLQNVYGEGQSLSNPYTGIISLFTALALNNKEIVLFENGTPVRDFIHVSDVAGAFLLAARATETGVFNIGSGERITILEVAKIIADRFGTTIRVTNLKRSGDVHAIFADITLAKKVLDFEPSLPLEFGLAKFMGWASVEHNFPDIIDKYKKSIEELEKVGLLNEDG